MATITQIGTGLDYIGTWRPSLEELDRNDLNLLAREVGAEIARRNIRMEENVASHLREKALSFNEEMERAQATDYERAERRAVELMIQSEELFRQAAELRDRTPGPLDKQGPW